jgi:hypothetical protein
MEPEDVVKSATGKSKGIANDRIQLPQSNDPSFCGLHDRPDTTASHDQQGGLNL